MSDERVLRVDRGRRLVLQGAKPLLWCDCCQKCTQHQFGRLVEGCAGERPGVLWVCGECEGETVCVQPYLVRVDERSNSAGSEWDYDLVDVQASAYVSKGGMLANVWLCGRLDDGPVLSARLIADGCRMGLTERQVRRAKGRLGVASVRVGRRWLWVAPWWQGGAGVSKG